MKIIILAGGYGTRLGSKTELIPKPLVEIGQKPIIWHIMKIYSFHGIHDFVICCGYKGNVIKEYFKNYFLHLPGVTFSMDNNSMKINQNNNVEPWKITLVDTGENTMTAKRLYKVKDFLDKDESFFLTYGDGISSINLEKLSTNFHLKNDFLVNLALSKTRGIFCFFISKIIFGQISDSTNIAKSGFQKLINFLFKKFVSIGKN